MAATVGDAAQAIATRLATISGLRTFAFDPSQYNPPVAFPILNSVQFHDAFGGGDVVMDFTIVLVAARWAERVSYSTLNAWMSYSGSSSIRAAIEGDKTLGGVVNTCVLASSASISSMTAGEADFLSVEFALTVHA
jgi:hypothetical protein